MYDHLFSSMNIGNVSISNRTVMTAMGNHLANRDGSVSDADIAFYTERAKGGTGLIITECACVDSVTGRGNLKQLCVDDDKFIPGLKALADSIHQYDSKVCIQLYHPGRQGIAIVNGVESMKAPSAIECQCVHQPVHEMSLEEVKEMIQLFIQGAIRAKKAGMDMVEFHGAHGYLIGQFLSPYTNHRTDEYGGSFENRLRFLDEIIDGARKELGDEYPILVRLSLNEFLEYAGVPNQGIDLQEGIKIAKHLEEKGVDALDLSSGIYESMNTAWEPVGFDQGWKMEGPAAVKKEVNIPIIATSVLRDPEFVDKAIEEGKIDFMGSARTFHADPHWANKARDGKEKVIRKCISCLYCMETLMNCDIPGNPDFCCAINYTSGKEYKVKEIKKDGQGKTVVVIGAGPAGMEASIVLAQRGFKVIILEKKNMVGGQIVLASKPSKKDKTAQLIAYQKEQLELLGVEIRLQTPATLELLKEINPYAVFIAQGSKPILPKSIKGIDGKNVYTPVQVLSGEISFENQKVVVVGSGMTGIETAEYIASKGNEVSVYEMADDIGPGLFFQNLIDVMSRIIPLGVKLTPKHKLVEIKDNEAIFETTDTKEIVKESFDSIVISLGVVSNTELVEEIKVQFEKVVILGDAIQCGRIEQAVRTGYEAAYNI